MYCAFKTDKLWRKRGRQKRFNSDKIGNSDEICERVCNVTPEIITRISNAHFFHAVWYSSFEMRRFSFSARIFSCPIVPSWRFSFCYFSVHVRYVKLLYCKSWNANCLFGKIYAFRFWNAKVDWWNEKYVNGSCTKQMDYEEIYSSFVCDDNTLVVSKGNFPECLFKNFIRKQLERLYLYTTHAFCQLSLVHYRNLCFPNATSTRNKHSQQ